jgi:hypothetical protein
MAENEAANEQKNVSEEEEVMSETAERTSEQNVLAGTKTVDGIMAVHLANTVDNANQASKVMIANLDARHLRLTAAMLWRITGIPSIVSMGSAGKSRYRWRPC